MDIVVEAISENFDGENGLKYTRDIELVAKSEGFFIEVRNNANEVLYRSSDIYLKNMGDNLFKGQVKRSKKDIFQTFYKEKSYNLTKNNKTYGMIKIGFYSIDNCDIIDLKMKDTIYDILMRTSVITFLAGIVMSVVLASNLSKPLKIMSKFTEIRTPLTTLQNTMEAFLDGIWEPTQDRIESCYEETLRLSKLVEGLKDIAKLENMNMTLEISEFNILCGIPPSSIGGGWITPFLFGLNT